MILELSPPPGFNAMPSEFERIRVPVTVPPFLSVTVVCPHAMKSMGDIRVKPCLPFGSFSLL